MPMDIVLFEERPGSGGKLIGTIQRVDVFFGRELWIYQKDHFWSRSRKIVLKSDVNIEDYLANTEGTITLLMKATMDGKLVPIVTKDKKMVGEISKILEAFMTEKQEEIEMLKDSQEALITYYVNQLKVYYEFINKLYSQLERVFPTMLSLLHNKFELFWTYVKANWSESDMEQVKGQFLRELELSFTDAYTQLLITDKFDKSQGNPKQKAFQISPKRRLPPPRPPEAPQGGMGGFMGTPEAEPDPHSPMARNFRRAAVAGGTASPSVMMQSAVEAESMPPASSPQSHPPPQQQSPPPSPVGDKEVGEIDEFIQAYRDGRIKHVQD